MSERWWEGENYRMSGLGGHSLEWTRDHLAELDQMDLLCVWFSCERSQKEYEEFRQLFNQLGYPTTPGAAMQGSFFSAM